MPHSIRHTFAATGFVALSLACAAAVPAGLFSTRPALAQQDAAPKQVALTQKQIDGLIAAQPEMAAAQPQSANSDRPDPKLQAKMEAIVKKHGFSSLEDYGDVSDSIGIVLAGLDPETKKYVGPTAVIKKQMQEVQADKSMKPQDKAQALKELKEAMAAGDGAKPPAGNAEIVSKNYDRLAQLLQGDGGNQ